MNENLTNMDDLAAEIERLTREAEARPDDPTLMQAVALLHGLHAGLLEALAALPVEGQR